MRPRPRQLMGDYAGTPRRSDDRRPLADSPRRRDRRPRVRVPPSRPGRNGEGGSAGPARSSWIFRPASGAPEPPPSDRRAPLAHYTPGARRLILQILPDALPVVLDPPIRTGPWPTSKPSRRRWAPGNPFYSVIVPAKTLRASRDPVRWRRLPGPRLITQPELFDLVFLEPTYPWTPPPETGARFTPRARRVRRRPGPSDSPLRTRGRNPHRPETWSPT